MIKESLSGLYNWSLQNVWLDLKRQVLSREAGSADRAIGYLQALNCIMPDLALDRARELDALILKMEALFGEKWV